MSAATGWSRPASTNCRSASDHPRFLHRQDRPGSPPGAVLFLGVCIAADTFSAVYLTVYSMSRRDVAMQGGGWLTRAGPTIFRRGGWGAIRSFGESSAMKETRDGWYRIWRGARFVATCRQDRRTRTAAPRLVHALDWGAERIPQAASRARNPQARPSHPEPVGSRRQSVSILTRVASPMSPSLRAGCGVRARDLGRDRPRAPHWHGPAAGRTTRHARPGRRAGRAAWQVASVG